MSRQLYEEALAEVKQLKQLAEENAKRAVLSEVEPKIRQLIEQNLASSSEDLDETMDMDMDESEAVPAEETVKEHQISKAAKKALAEILGEGPYTESQITTAINVYEAMWKKPDSLHEAKKSIEIVEGLYVIAANVLGEKKLAVHEGKLNSCYSKASKSLKALKAARLSEAVLNLKIAGFDDQALDADMLNNLSIEIVPETEGAEASEETPAEETPKGEEEKAAVAGEEPAGEEEIDVTDLDLGDEETSAEGEPPAQQPAEKTEEPVKKEGRNMDKFAMLSDDTVVEIDEGMLRREIARMKALREAKEGMPKASKNAPKGHGVKGTAHHFGGGKEEGEAFLDGESFFDSEDLMEALEESDVLEIVGEEEMAHKDEAYGAADEAKLDAELAEMLGELDAEEDLDEKMASHGEEDLDEKMASHGEEDLDEKMASHGEEDLDESDMEESGTENSLGAGRRRRDENPGKEPEVDAHHSVLENKLVEARKKAAKKAKMMKEKAKSAKSAKEKEMCEAAFRSAVSDYNKASNALKALHESAHRSNSGENKEVETLRNQLAETNLFNAKLLYTNKLLQNESLSARQKVAVIEKLDEARSLREAKLVYESLTRTIASGKASVNESADRQVLGSASRATRPSSTVSLNEGVETARWARLAGIK